MPKMWIVLALLALGQTPSSTVNVKTKGVLGDGIADDGPALKAIFANATGTIEFTPGMYETCSSIPISNAARVAVIVDAGATIQVKPNCGFPTPNWPIFQVLGASAGVDFRGMGLLDANYVGGKAVQFDPGASGTVTNVEIKNTVGTFAPGISKTGRGQVTVSGVYIHDCASGMYALWGAVLKVLDSRVDNVHGTGIGGSGLLDFEVTGTSITRSMSKDGSLYCYGCDHYSWTRIYDAYNAAGDHCDTCGGGEDAYNTYVENGGSLPDTFVEASSCVSVHNNVSHGAATSGGTGVFVGIGDNRSPDQLRTQIQSFDSVGALVASPGVSLSTDSVDKREGHASLVVSTDRAFVSGTLFYQNLPTGLCAGAGCGFPFQELWVKPIDAPLASGDLQIVLSKGANLVETPPPFTGQIGNLIVPLPAAPQGLWFHVVTYANGWQAAADGVGFKSFGLRLNGNHSNFIMKVDDYRAAFEMVGNSVVSNTVINPGGVCIAVGGLQGGVIRENNCVRSTVDTTTCIYSRKLDRD